MQSAMIRSQGVAKAAAPSAVPARKFLAQPRAAPMVARRQLTTTGALADPDNVSILVCGGGGTALSVTRTLKDMGAWVWMLQRTENHRAEIEKMMAFVLKGDALDEATVEAAFGEIEEVDAVVSTIGGTTQNPEADSQGNINVINAAIKKGVTKFVLVTSIGCGPTKDAVTAETYEVLKPVLEQKNKAEEHLKNSGLTFTIIRPGGLKSEPATGNGVITEDVGVCGLINRDDVAQLVAKSLFKESTDNKEVSAVDKDGLFGDVTFEVIDL